MPLVSKTFSQIITFTRASTATFFDSAGVLQSAAIDVPRFDYNPATLAAQGFLIEEARTNSCLQSEDFATTWTNSNSVEQTNVLVAPDGTLTADLLQADSVTTSSAREFRQNINGTVSAVHAFSVFAKAKDGDFLGLAFRNQAAAANFCSAEFNLSTGAISVAATNGGAATGATASITPINNGWYRCSVSGIADTSGTQFTVLLTGRTTSNNNSVVADTELVYVWGAQLEAGAFPTSYIPTTTTALTRAADVASVNTLSPWYNAAEGTLYAEFVWEGLKSVAGQRIAVIDDGSTNNYWGALATSTNVMQGAVVVSGTTEAVNSTPATTYTANTLYKQTLALELNNSVSAINGTAGTSDTSVSVPSGLTTLRLAASSSTVTSNIWFRRITYYPRRLSNAELATLTT